MLHLICIAIYARANSTLESYAVLDEPRGTAACAFGAAAALVEEQDVSEPWGDLFLDAVNWLTGSKAVFVISVILLCLGTHDSLAQITRTSFFCAGTLDSAASTLFIQVLGMCLDAAVLALLWQIMSWTKSTHARLQALSSVLQLTFALALSVFTISALFSGRSIWAVYMSDVFTSGFLLSAVLVAFTILMCESTPMAPAATLVMAVGQVASLENVARMQIWLHGTAFGTIRPLYYLFFGYSLILSRRHFEMLKTIQRLFIFCSLAVIIFTALPLALLREGRHELHIHPLNKLIYEARIMSDTWLVKVSTSGSLRVAVSEYRERNHGREPPPGFDAWYSFALEKKSAIIDHFPQINHDLLPFRKLSPKVLRQRVSQLSDKPGIAVVEIRGGKVSTTSTMGEPSSKLLSHLVSMISAFSKHLPDMDIPVNLHDRPRVLQTSRQSSDAWTPTSVAEWQHAISRSCPPGSSARSRTAWSVRDFTTRYLSSYSKWQFTTYWEGSLDTCDQADVPYLHGFHMAPQANGDLFVQLMPVFSRSKTGGFGDILLPFPNDEDAEQESMGNFNGKETNLYWRGGGPPLPNNGEKFAYARIPTMELNGLLPLDVAFTTEREAHTCSGTSCDLARLELGAAGPQTAPLDHRYLLVLDADTGPSTNPTAMAAMGSSAVPFVSTIFTHWYWSATLSYFTGLQDQTQSGADREGEQGEGGQEPGTGHVTIAGKAVGLSGNLDDARWIASQGKAWAKRP
ncbi:unnamed protein product [Parascedosporium putredinis]|uniref:Uncharacterized protein n=1 Tax=Parascedosporium putredinis TaxID=1442378 RepID=A0A9P1MDC9_9PEZI|nr:unnamed protein product [Parascedosporium putredinis]CAI8002328.1 unnamed protein product [Parascedosporium putredinis]